MRKAHSKPLTCLSLFSGCGGLDLGLEAAGFRVVTALDANEDCSASYRANFPSTPFILDRIGQVSTESLIKHAGTSEIDLLAGGPPCPAFSKSRFYRTDKPRALNDPVAAETVGGYLRVLRDLRPRAFILENVRGLAYGVHKEALDHILNTAEGLGYAVGWHIYNAADYGVPQIRERCVVMGSLTGPVIRPRPTHAKVSGDALSLAEPWVTAGEVLGDLDTDANADDKGHFAGGKHHDLLCGIPPGENYLFYTKERGHPQPKFIWRSRYWSFLLKLSPDLPAWTIQARRSNNMGPLHWRNRILRIGEVKRLQTFPDAFELCGRLESQWRQVGNAVPPEFARALGDAIRHHLEHTTDARLVA
ncbi:MAG TPA: DNA cytosine methyltransferase [Rhizomicrobium sp.]|jgi:DNA (cytosine-5)-methyltransferase 1